MPSTKEFSIQLDDRPGTLGTVCRTLADQGVNILAFQSTQSGGKSLTRLVVDNSTTAKKALDNNHVSYTMTDVAQVRLANRTGELARAAARLGEANININYAYCGLDPGTSSPLVILGTTNVGQTVTILDQATASAAGQ